MKRKGTMRKWWVLLLLGFLLLIIFYKLGFRVTYNPDIINDWTAIDAIGTWFCGAIIPVGLFFLEKRLSESESKTSTSNLALLEELNEFKQKYESQFNTIDSNNTSLGADFSKTELSKHTYIPSSQEIYRYICISMIASTSDIAKHFGVKPQDIKSKLDDLWAVQELISPATLSDDPITGYEACEWTKSK